MDEVSLTPQRVAANTKYSKLLIQQGGAEVDSLIANELAAAMNAYIDDYGFDTIMASTAVNQTQTADAILTAATVNLMESQALAQGANLAGASYVMSPNAYANSKALAQVNSVNALWDAGQFQYVQRSCNTLLGRWILSRRHNSSRANDFRKLRTGRYPCLFWFARFAC